MTQVPAVAVTAASAPRTREITNVGPYARSERASAQPDYTNIYRDDLNEPRSASPTDYYGQAMTPSDSRMADRYADDLRSLQMPIAAVQNPFQSSHPRDIEAQETLDDRQPQRGTKTPRQSMPQLPPLSPSVFDSPLGANFPPGTPAMQQQALLQKLHPQAVSRSPSQVKRAEEELRKGYADLAKAAQVDEPITPHLATMQRDALTTDVTQPQPALFIPPERYQHGRPLSPLEEVETPLSMASYLPEAAGVDTSVFALTTSPSEQRGTAASTRLPLPGRPFTPENRHYRSGSNVSSASSLLPPHSGIPPSVHNPPPSPGVSLPESPSGSFVGDGPSLAPQLSAGDAHQRGPFLGKGGSAVSLEAAYPETPDAYRFSAGAWSSPGSSRTLDAPQNRAQESSSRYGYAVQQGPSRRSIVPEDAYGGI
jgi:hypothetical protein